MNDNVKLPNNISVLYCWLAISRYKFKHQLQHVETDTSFITGQEINSD